MHGDRAIVLKYCPYGKLFVEGDQEWMVISRRRVMREVGRLLDEAGKGVVEIRFTAVPGSASSDNCDTIVP
jgi:hypothetical protein